MNRPIVKCYINKTNKEIPCTHCDEPIQIDESFKGITDIDCNGNKFTERELCECCADDELECYSDFY